MSIIDDCIPLIKRLAVGRYAISIGGSWGKGTFDQNSDVDFRLFCDEIQSNPKEKEEIWQLIQEQILKWRNKGIEIDGCWVRKISEIDKELNDWLEGHIKPVEKIWTIWGYYLLSDIYYQYVVEDPFDVIAGWKIKLKQYPSNLKKAILDKHMGSLKYWMNDYHYLNKVKRKDMVFLSSLSAKMVHDLMQVIFALNETYFVGDGSNLEFIKSFKYKPRQFEERVKSALYPIQTENMFEEQRKVLIDLTQEIEKMVESLT